MLQGKLNLSKNMISLISKFFESSKVLQLKLLISILLRQFHKQKVLVVVIKATHYFLGCKAATLILLGATILRLNNILFLLVMSYYVNAIIVQIAMIIANQQIAVHLKLIRNLTGITSGRFMLRIAIHEINLVKNNPATPFNLLEKQPGKHENRSQFDQGYYSSRNFFLKAGMNVELNEICIFKLNSPLYQAREDICNIKLVAELIHVDYNKSKVVSQCISSINQRSFHSFLELNFYEGGPCQIVGTIHSCVYKYEFFSEQDSAIDIRAYAERYSKWKIDQIADYLSGQGNNSFHVIARNYHQLTGKEPEVTCIFPEKDEKEEEQSQKQAEQIKEVQLQKQQVKEKQAPKTLKMIPLTIVAQKRQRKKLFAPPPEFQKTEGDEDYPETDPKIGQKKKRRKIFHTTSKQMKWQKVTMNEKLLHENAQKIYQIWREIVGKLFQQEGQKFFQTKSAQFKEHVKERVGESVIRFKGNIEVDMYGDEEQMRNKLAYQLRNQDKSYFKDFKTQQANIFTVLDDSFFSIQRPIFFEESAKVEGAKQFKPPKQVLVIMVHGLGACRLDMEKIKSQLRRYYDFRIKMYISTSNEARTQGNIEEMGTRLAAEVDYEIGKHSDIPQICFLGHSMGGLIIRAALPRLKKYKDHFHSLITLSSPHLGFLYSTSTLIDAGLWFINTMKKCTSIQQMTMQDNPDLRETFLYKLSEKPGLQWFNRLVFIGSHQDLYVPYYSARIQKHEDSILDCRKQVTKGIVCCKMVENLISKFKGEIIRVNVNFCIPQQNIDNLIGRAAHISFINSVEVVRTFVIAGPHYFF